MSRANVEIVKQAYEAWNRGELDAVLENFDSNVEWWDRGDSFHATVRRGHDGLMGGWAEIAEAFSEFRMEPQEFIDAGDYVVVPIHRVGTGRASGALIEEDEVHVFRMRAGKTVELREYHEKQEALQAVGWRGSRHEPPSPSPSAGGAPNPSDEVRPQGTQRAPVRPPTGCRRDRA